MPLYPPGPSHFHPIDLLRDFETIHPAREALMDRWTQNFTQMHVPKSNPVRALNVEVILTPEQAERGGVLPFDVPRATVCPRCEGTGVAGLFTCDLCDGHGLEWQTARIDAILSAPVREGTTIDIPLNQVGVTNFFLRVQTHIASA